MRRQMLWVNFQILRPRDKKVFQSRGQKAFEHTVRPTKEILFKNKRLKVRRSIEFKCHTRLERGVIFEVALTKLYLNLVPFRASNFIIIEQIIRYRSQRYVCCPSFAVGLSCCCQGSWGRSEESIRSQRHHVWFQFPQVWTWEHSSCPSSLINWN